MAKIPVTQKQALIILIQEASEVIKEATKCIQYGLETEYEGMRNVDRLSLEVGDFYGAVDMLILADDLVLKAKMNKLDRVLKARKMHEGEKK